MRVVVPSWSLHKVLLFLGMLLFLPSSQLRSEELCPLQLRFLPYFNRLPLGFDAAELTTPAGQKISVNRLDFLISGIALRQPDGTWLAAESSYGLVLGRPNKLTCPLQAVPAGKYNAIRFQIGVPEQENHADPAQWPSDHPLNPNRNGLHWSWRGGYVFFAIEGSCQREDGTLGGYSWHLATDPLLTTIELPMNLEIRGGTEIRLRLLVDHLFRGNPPIRISDETASTHSRENDPLASQLQTNLKLSFATDGTGSWEPPEKTPPVLDMAKKVTPFRFTFADTFPIPSLPRDNPLTEEGVALGRRLFNDPLLSINNTQSCASCHPGNAHFADGKALSLGAEGKPGRRSSMPLENLAWKEIFFWDGRAPSLRKQVLQPIQDPLEMHETLPNVIGKLGKPYRGAFAAVFRDDAITEERIAKALEQFLLVQTSGISKLDRAMRGEASLTPEEQRGFELFHTEYDPGRGQIGADCFHCHGGPLFRSQDFGNNGLDETPSDPGRFLITQNPADQAKFAVPSLRNVARTAPYMHDGRFSTLEEVVAHYNSGVKLSRTLDPNLAKHPKGGLQLSKEDQAALVAFLKTLSSE